jgi:hypothetical protein
MLNVLHIIGAGIYVVAYATATTIAHLSEHHQDMFIAYALITTAAIVHLCVAIGQVRRKGK